MLKLKFAIVRVGLRLNYSENFSWKEKSIGEEGKEVRAKHRGSDPVKHTPGGLAE